MTTPFLQSISIRDFRSVSGTVLIPLDSPVVLIHGQNGAGKTSVMTAIELALTGESAPLRRTEADYVQHLVRLGAEDSEISLATAAGDYEMRNHSIRIPAAAPFEGVLDESDAAFFSERCYLAQSTLSRLLEIYEAADTGTESPLTRFVKELLRLDRYEALIDGLHPLGDVRNLRKFVPEFGAGERGIEVATKELLEHELAATTAEGHLQQMRRDLGDLLARLGEPTNVAEDLPGLQQIEARLSSDADQSKLIQLGAARQEASVLEERLKALGEIPSEAESAAAARAATDALEKANVWRSGPGTALELHIAALRDLFPDLPSAASTDPVTARSSAASRVADEVRRCSAILADDATASQAATTVAAEVANARARLSQIDEQLASDSLTSDAGALASAIAALLPHIDGQECPVCGRDYAEVSDQPLSGHIASLLAQLSENARQLQALASARLEASSDVSAGDRQLAELQQKILQAEVRVELMQRLARLSDASQALAVLETDVATGSALLRQAVLAEQSASGLREKSRARSDLEGSIESLALRAGYLRKSGHGPSELLSSVSDALDNQIKALGQIVGLRRAGLDAVVGLRAAIDQRLKREAALLKSRQRLERLRGQVARAAELREAGRLAARTATEARAEIVGHVFNDSLNTVWRDLFVRLAPAEPFVPQFRIPGQQSGSLAAQLETVTRSGQRAGSPAVMLSSGNLNTAALTLFLALHLSAPRRLPCLLLDDPVQSMDDVHIAQFAALLRTLSKRHGRQVVVAVHDRALFEYLTLELSPAFPGDRLVTVELTRADGVDTSAVPTYYSWEVDPALIAAS